jgi:hypothetical protein
MATCVHTARHTHWVLRHTDGVQQLPCIHFPLAPRADVAHARGIDRTANICAAFSNTTAVSLIMLGLLLSSYIRMCEYIRKAMNTNQGLHGAHFLNRANPAQDFLANCIDESSVACTMALAGLKSIIQGQWEKRVFVSTPKGDASRTHLNL